MTTATQLPEATSSRRLVDAGAAFAAYAACDDRAEVTREAYLTAFTFGEDFRRLLLETGSTAGFSGPCWAPWLWWDIDCENLEQAQADAFQAEMLVLDYIQRIPPPGEHGDKRGSVDATMNYLRQFADAGVAVVVVAAVSRGKDSKGRSTYAGDALTLRLMRTTGDANRKKTPPGNRPVDRTVDNVIIRTP